MEATDVASQVYSGTYSNVPVYEVIHQKTHVMRRRADDWINATHILIVAGFDKAARTKILEREVQRSDHEKVQGGYGKYQGTWISLPSGSALAQKYGVYDKLAPIFEFVPGDQSPPPAPKHTTAATNRAKAARSTAAAGATAAAATKASRAAPVPVDARSVTSDAYDQVPPSMPPSSSHSQAPEPMMATEMQPPSSSRKRGRRGRPPKETPQRKPPQPQKPLINSQNSMPNIDSQATDSGTTSADEENSTFVTDQSMMAGKRRRLPDIEEDTTLATQHHDHLLYTDELLDYLMAMRDAEPTVEFARHPEPPPDFHPDTVIDKSGHTVLHWAAALADLDLVATFMNRGASIHVVNKMHETPLMSACQYINSYERRTMPRLISILGSTIDHTDLVGSTALHHAATLTSQPNLAPAGRYYFDTILSYLSQHLSGRELSRILDIQNMSGDTALIMVARQGDQPSVRTLVGYGASARIANDHGFSADDYLRERRERARAKRSAALEAALPNLTPNLTPSKAVADDTPLAAAGYSKPAVNADGDTNADDDDNDDGDVDDRYAIVNGAVGNSAGAAVRHKMAKFRSLAALRLTEWLGELGEQMVRQVCDLRDRELVRITAERAAIDDAAAKVDHERVRMHARLTRLHLDEEGYDSSADKAELATAEQELYDLIDAYDRAQLETLNNGRGSNSATITVDDAGNAVHAQAGGGTNGSQEQMSDKSQQQQLQQQQRGQPFLPLAAPNMAENGHDPSQHISNDAPSQPPEQQQQPQQHEQHEQEHLAAAINEAEAERRQLLRELVQLTAVAGSRKKTAQYKRLIAGCLSVDEAEVQELAPLILEHLEAERRRSSTIPVIASASANGNAATTTAVAATTAATTATTTTAPITTGISASASARAAATLAAEAAAAMADAYPSSPTEVIRMKAAVPPPPPPHVLLSRPWQ